MTDPAPVVGVYEAKEFDVIERENEITRWESLPEEQRQVTLKPAVVQVGDQIQKTVKPKGQSIFWTKGITVHMDGTREGEGLFNLEMLLYQK